MKKALLFPLLLSVPFIVSAQTTWESVYSLLSTNCGACHVAGHESGLDLSGSITEVYDNLYNVSAHNSAADDKGYKVIMPGDPYKSFLFSKINNGLALDVHLSTGEGDACPQGAAPLADKDIELVRQWILYGAQEDSDEVDQALVADFYDHGGIQSVPSPPAAPDPSEGFQIHYGPYFLAPEDEHEYWSKFSTDLPEDIEINKFDVEMGEYSHHFIIYKYEFPTYVGNPYGFRTNDPEFLGVSLVTANQYAATLTLPENTAFAWDAGTWLDLNSHYINYSSELPLACEVYINVYTQPAGTAIQEMHSELPANTDIYIPNDDMPHTFTDELYDNSPGEIYLWAVTSHTHKYGDDFDIYRRTLDGEKGEKIFDGSCGATEGVPGCVDEIYDYKHPPTRYWEHFLPMKVKEGMIYEATYVNDGDYPVSFGLTSNDEMMVMIYFYIDDTTGLNLPTAIEDVVPSENNTVSVHPNPVHDVFYVSLSDAVLDKASMTVELIDVNGAIIYTKNAHADTAQGDGMTVYLSRDMAPAGIYMIRLHDQQGHVVTQKVIFE